jgi:hypothetical protein
MKRITITTREYAFKATLNTSPTAEQIYNSLPLKGKATIWGEEIYFSIPIDIPEEVDARQTVESGEIAYWPMGDAFCIFFGPTPASNDTKPIAYSPVNVFGKIDDNLDNLRKVKPGDEISVVAG